MPLAKADRCRETSTTTGTGTYDLAGAVAGFQGLVAGIGTGNTCYYAAIMGANWEVGIGTVTDAATDTLARTTILQSSNADAAVSWGAGTKDIFVTLPADKIIQANAAGAVVLPAGGTGAGTAPLYLTTQASPLATPEQGALELIGNSLQFTNLAVRRSVVQANSVRVTSTTVGNTTTETEVFTTPHGANYLTVGKAEEVKIRGRYSSVNAAGANTLAIRVKWAGTTIATFTTVEAATSNVPMEILVWATVRSIGATGTVQISADCHIDTVTNDADISVLPTIDTTAAGALSVTLQWSDVAAGNTVTIENARVVCYDNPA